MPYRHRLQTNRYELKYLISEACASGIREFAGTYLEPDEHARAEQPNGAYPITSLYLDTPLRALCGQTISGLKNRFKLRIRFYDEEPDSPAFLEIKRRTTDVIRKQRAAVTREAVYNLLDGRSPNPSQLMETNGRSSIGSLMDFCELCDRIGAGTSIYVSYLREAYVSPGSDQVRMTFDRQLLGSRFDWTAGLTMPAQGNTPDLGGVILELKFTDRFPIWMREMAEAFDLQRRSVAKYVLCVEAMRLQPDRRRIATGEVVR